MALTTATKYVHALELVDIDELVSHGVSCVLVDRDNTCIPRNTGKAPEAVKMWCDRARDAGLRLFMVSNNFHSKEIAASASELKMDVIDHAMKPFPFALLAAMRRLGVSSAECVMLGDQILTDIIAGNLCGTRTILVRPQCEEDNWYTRIFRMIEKKLLRNVSFEGE